MNNMSNHPFEAFIPIDSKSIIIGTIPPQRFCLNNINLYPCDVNFYYGSKDNHFWEIIENINNIKFTYENNLIAIQERKDFLSSIGIGITDIIKSCIHKNSSSSDKDLESIEFKNIKELLKNNSSIDTLIYTSDFVKKLMNDYLVTYHNTIKNENRRFNLKIDGKTYNVIILYSPSPQALRGMNENGKEIRIEQYKSILKK